MERILHQIPFLRLSAALAMGIILGRVFLINQCILLLFIVLTLLGLYWINRIYTFYLVVYFGAGVHLLFILTGMFIFTRYNRKPCFFQSGEFCATVCEMMQEKPNSYETVLHIQAVKMDDTLFRSDEKVTAWFEKAEKARNLVPGDVVMFTPTPWYIKNDHNPYEFNYQNYLARRKIFRQVYLPCDRWSKSRLHSGFSLVLHSERIRKQMIEVYREHIPDQKVVNILSALTLGYKRGLGRDTKQTFSTAGAMHVLAVSGLHTGIIFLMLSWLLGFMKKQRSGRWLFILLVLVALWSFAFLTGLSPSVKRSATMFSFVVIGQGIKKRSNIYNTLAASAFLLLLINPNDLYEVGFQLSYAAVFGIVFLQEVMNRFFYFKNSILRYVSGLLTVTTSAQVITFPLIAYYFHQFPIYSWLSNLIVIPAVTILIPLGISLLLFHWIPALTTLLSHGIVFILHPMVHFLEEIEKLPFSIVELSFSKMEFVFLMCLLLSILLFIKTTKVFYLKAVLFFFFFMTSSSLSIKIYNLYRREIIVYNYPDQQIVHLISGRENYLVSPDSIHCTEMAWRMVDQTVRALCLDEPFFIQANSTYGDSRILLKNGFIFFEGRSIYLGDDKGPDSLIPEIRIGPYPQKYAECSPLQGRKIISTLKYTDRFSTQCDSIFFLDKEGAFREKW
ncbi:MAG: ComEC/Rec2 family competence protein [Mariniphaga sp.]|nr:ComEC/Rec2 family competence protein [Mariniphaga sp.]